MSATMRTKSTFPTDLLADSRRKLESLMGSDGICASDSPNYRQALFGRDSLEGAEDVLSQMPELAALVIQFLSSVQGSRYDAVSEEEPGKIMHELRRMVMNGQPVGLQQRIILSKLAAIWGGTQDEVLYFGTADATCLYVRLLCGFVKRFGKQILFERVPVLHRPSETKSILACLIDAATWVERRISRSDLGLLEFCRTNRHGHRFQVWQDGATAYVHADGTLPNARKPIAELALQGLAYDALVLAARTLQGAFPTMARRWFRLARNVRRSLIKWFWLPEEQFFAPLIDRDAAGQPRHVLVSKASAGEVLDTGILDDLPDAQRDGIVEHVAHRLFSEEFLTPYGLRTRSLRWADLLPYADYQGSLVTWPKQSMDVARGCRKYGLTIEATVLEDGILRLVRQAGCYLEFGYVGLDGRLGYAPPEGEGQFELIAGTNVPEANQAWTASAVHHILSRREMALEMEEITALPIFVDVARGREAEATYMKRAA